MSEDIQTISPPRFSDLSSIILKAKTTSKPLPTQKALKKAGAESLTHSTESNSKTTIPTATTQKKKSHEASEKLADPDRKKKKKNQPHVETSDARQDSQHTVRNFSDPGQQQRQQKQKKPPPAAHSKSAGSQLTPPSANPVNPVPLEQPIVSSASQFTAAQAYQTTPPLSLSAPTSLSPQTSSHLNSAPAFSSAPANTTSPLLSDITSMSSDHQKREKSTVKIHLGIKKKVHQETAAAPAAPAVTQAALPTASGQATPANAASQVTTLSPAAASNSVQKKLETEAAPSSAASSATLGSEASAEESPFREPAKNKRRGAKIQDSPAPAIRERSGSKDSVGKSPKGTAPQQSPKNAPQQSPKNSTQGAQTNKKSPKNPTPKSPKNALNKNSGQQKPHQSPASETEKDRKPADNKSKDTKSPRGNNKDDRPQTPQGENSGNNNNSNNNNSSKKDERKNKKKEKQSIDQWQRDRDEPRDDRREDRSLRDRDHNKREREDRSLRDRDDNKRDRDDRSSRDRDDNKRDRDDRSSRDKWERDDRSARDSNKSNNKRSPRSPSRRQRSPTRRGGSHSPPRSSKASRRSKSPRGSADRNDSKRRENSSSTNSNNSSNNNNIKRSKSETPNEGAVKKLKAESTSESIASSELTPQQVQQLHQDAKNLKHVAQRLISSADEAEVLKGFNIMLEACLKFLELAVYQESKSKPDQLEDFYKKTHTLMENQVEKLSSDKQTYLQSLFYKLIAACSFKIMMLRGPQLRQAYLYLKHKPQEPSPSESTPNSTIPRAKNPPIADEMERTYRCFDAVAKSEKCGDKFVDIMNIVQTVRKKHRLIWDG